MIEILKAGNDSNMKFGRSLCCYLLPWENRAYAKCCPLSVGTLHQSRITFLIGNFTRVPIKSRCSHLGGPIMNFI